MEVSIFIVVSESSWPGRHVNKLKTTHLTAGDTPTPRDFIELRMSPHLSFSVSSAA